MLGAVVPGDAHVGTVVPDDAHVGAVVPDDAHVGAVVPDDAHVGAVIPDDVRAGAVIPDDARVGAVIPNDGCVVAVVPADEYVVAAAPADECVVVVIPDAALETRETQVRREIREIRATQATREIRTTRGILNNEDDDCPSSQELCAIIICGTIIWVPVLVSIIIFVPAENNHPADIVPTNTTYSNNAGGAIELSTGSMMNSKYSLLAAVLMLVSVGVAVAARVKNVVENRWPTLFNAKDRLLIEQKRKGAEEDRSADFLCFKV